VKKSFFLVILAILLAGLILFRLSDTAISVADTVNFNNEVTSTMSKASNSPASATITITMTGILNE
jgi:beta-lactamase regulating signal transducer with metallopeptidase domain